MAQHRPEKRLCHALSATHPRRAAIFLQLGHAAFEHTDLIGLVLSYVTDRIEGYELETDDPFIHSMASHAFQLMKKSTLYPQPLHSVFCARPQYPNPKSPIVLLPLLSVRIPKGKWDLFSWEMSEIFACEALYDGKETYYFSLNFWHLRGILQRFYNNIRNFKSAWIREFVKNNEPIAKRWVTFLDAYQRYLPLTDINVLDCQRILRATQNLLRNPEAMPDFMEDDN